jgi:hypothetical protein
MCSNQSPEEQLGALLLQLAEQEPADLRALSDVEVRQLHTLEGAATASSWVQAQSIPGVDRGDVALARRLHVVPTVSEQLLAGRLSASAAGSVAAAVAKARPFLDRPDGLIDGLPAVPALYGVCVDGICTLLAEQVGGSEPDGLRALLEEILESPTTKLAAFEAALVELALRSQAGLLRDALGLLIDALLPAQHDARARRAEKDASFLLSRKSGGSGWLVNGELSDETGEMLHVVLTAEEAVDPDNRADTDAYRAVADRPELADLDPVDWPADLRQPRTRGQRQHAALHAGLRRLLGSGELGRREKAYPHIAIVAELDFVQGVPGALPGRAASGARWSRQQVRAALCQGTFTRLVLDAKRRVVDVSHTSRTAKAVERLILQLQWGGRCAVRGCRKGPATGARLVPHHGDLFRDTGTTSLDDSVPLCEPDHHYLHADGRELQLKDGRWIGPDGWVLRAA